MLYVTRNLGNAAEGAGVRFLTAHQHKQTIQCHSRWYTVENETEDKLKTDTTKTKHNPEKQTTQNTAKQN